MDEKCSDTAELKSIFERKFICFMCDKFKQNKLKEDVNF